MESQLILMPIGIVMMGRYVLIHVIFVLLHDPFVYIITKFVAMLDPFVCIIIYSSLRPFCRDGELVNSLSTDPFVSGDLMFVPSVIMIPVVAVSTLLSRL
jgi:hypothetical protein